MRPATVLLLLYPPVRVHHSQLIRFKSFFKKWRIYVENIKPAGQFVPTVELVAETTNWGCWRRNCPIASHGCLSCWQVWMCPDGKAAVRFTHAGPHFLSLELFTSAVLRFDKPESTVSRWQTDGIDRRRCGTAGSEVTASDRLRLWVINYVFFFICATSNTYPENLEILRVTVCCITVEGFLRKAAKQKPRRPESCEDVAWNVTTSETLIGIHARHRGHLILHKNSEDLCKSQPSRRTIIHHLPK